MTAKCVVCGKQSHRISARWVMAIVNKAREHGLTLTEPHGSGLHRRCENALHKLVANKRARP